MAQVQSTLYTEINNIEISQDVLDSEERLEHINKLIELEERVEAWPIKSASAQPPNLHKYRGYAETLKSFYIDKSNTEHAKTVMDIMHRYAENNSIVERVLNREAAFTEEFQTFIEKYLNTPQSKRSEFINDHPEHKEILPLQERLGKQSKYFVKAADNEFGVEKTKLGTIASKIQEKAYVIPSVAALVGLTGMAVDTLSTPPQPEFMEYVSQIYEWPLLIGAGLSVIPAAIYLRSRSADEPLDSIINNSIYLQGRHDSSSGLLMNENY